MHAAKGDFAWKSAPVDGRAAAHIRLEYAVDCFAERRTALAVRVRLARDDVIPRDLWLATTVEVLQRPCMLTTRAEGDARRTVIRTGQACGAYTYHVRASRRLHARRVTCYCVRVRAAT